MASLLTAFASGIGRRLFRVQVAVIAVVYLVAAGVLGWQSEASRDAFGRDVLAQAASRSAAVVDTRLAAADAVVQALVAATPDRPDAVASLRARLPATRALRAVRVLAEDAPGVAAPDAAELDALRSGSSLLRIAAPAAEGLTPVHIARLVPAGGRAEVVLFELAPEWLWAPLAGGGAGAPALMVYGSRGEPLFDVGAASAAALPAFAARLGVPLRPGSSFAVASRVGDDAWNGAVAALPVDDGFAGAPLAIVAAAPDRGLAAAVLEVAAGLLPLGLLAVLGAAFCAALLASRYVLPLRRLEDGLLAMPRASAPPSRIDAATDEVGRAVDAFNAVAKLVHDERALLQALAAVDSLLLDARDSEAAVERLLPEVRRVTGCRAAGITLVETGTQRHGRLFTVGRDDIVAPVSRVLLDPDMIVVLGASASGLTIARCEEVRHSFLLPLQAAGGQIFWVWPVYVEKQLAAVLAVGFDEAEPLEERIAQYGTACAQRLGLALSASARTETLYQRAHYDPLTELPNRLLFRDRLAQELADIGETRERGALLYVDLDHFKRVNDSLGHSAGDQLLTITAQRLRGCVKDGDTVSRLAGDEFTVILRRIEDSSDAAAIAARVIEALQAPVNLAGREYSIRASIGVTLFPDDGEDIDQLLQNADVAMYRAKERGRGTAVLYEPRMAPGAGVIAQSGLYRALRQREFSLVFQPQYSLVNGELMGVEALLRWDSPRYGHREPDDFVPAAEESGLIVDIGRWTIEAGCAQLAQWRDAGRAPPRLALNLSLPQLRDGRLVQLVRRQLDRHGLPAAMLEFEMKESVFADARAIETAEALARLGVRLSIDDFGVGSSLTRLRGYPVHCIKLDRSLLCDLPAKESSVRVAETIIEMAHALGREVSAEGVETIEQLDFLRSRGCDVVQGYYLARPLTSTDLSELLGASSASPLLPARHASHSA